MTKNLFGVKLTKSEKAACRVLSLLRYDCDGGYYKCGYNDAILEAAQEVLKGKDPIEFMRKLFDSKEWEEDLIIANFNALR